MWDVGIFLQRTVFISRKNALLGSFFMPTARGSGRGGFVIVNCFVASFTLARMSASDELTIS